MWGHHGTGEAWEQGGKLTPPAGGRRRGSHGHSPVSKAEQTLRAVKNLPEVLAGQFPAGVSAEGQDDHRHQEDNQGRVGDGPMPHSTGSSGLVPASILGGQGVLSAVFLGLIFELGFSGSCAGPGSLPRTVHPGGPATSPGLPRPSLVWSLWPQSPFLRLTKAGFHGTVSPPWWDAVVRARSHPYPCHQHGKPARSSRGSQKCTPAFIHLYMTSSLLP